MRSTQRISSASKAFSDKPRFSHNTRGYWLEVSKPSRHYISGLLATPEEFEQLLKIIAKGASSPLQSISSNHWRRNISNLINVGHEHVATHRTPDAGDKLVVFRWWEWHDAGLRDAKEVVGTLIRNVERNNGLHATAALTAARQLTQIASDLGYRPAPLRQRYWLSRNLDYWLGQRKNPGVESVAISTYPNAILHLLLPVIELLRSFFRPELAQKQPRGMPQRISLEETPIIFLQVHRALIALRTLYDSVLRITQAQFNLRSLHSNCDEHRVAKMRIRLSERHKEWERTIHGSQIETSCMRLWHASHLSLKTNLALRCTGTIEVARIKKVTYENGPGYPDKDRSRERFVWTNIGKVLKTLDVKIAKSTFFDKMRGWQNKTSNQDYLRSLGKEPVLIPRPSKSKCL